MLEVLMIGKLIPLMLCSIGGIVVIDGSPLVAPLVLGK